MPPRKKKTAVPTLLDADENIAEALAELRRIRKNSQRRDRYTHKMPAVVKSGAGILLCRSEGNVKPALEFLAFKTGRPLEVLQTWMSALRSWYNKLGLDEKKTTSEATEVKHAKGAQMLNAFSLEKSLNTWVNTQNIEKGIPPCTGVVMQKLQEFKSAEHLLHAPSRARNYRSSLQYLRSWRTRWRIQKGRIQPLEIVPPDELLRKVGGSPAPLVYTILHLPPCYFEKIGVRIVAGKRVPHHCAM